MLRVESIEWRSTPKPIEEMTATELFDSDVGIDITLTAPMFWWYAQDEMWCDFVYHAMTSTEELRFSFDSWYGEEKVCDYLSNLINQAAVEKNERSLLEILPMGTMVTSTISTTYRSLVYECEDYAINLSTREAFPIERERNDYFETLMDIKGVRENMEVKPNEQD